MYTKKRIGLFLLAAFGLIILTGCGATRASYAGPEGVKIEIQGYNQNYSQYTVTTANDKYVVNDKQISQPFQWNYDRDPGQFEYVIVEYTQFGFADNNIRQIDLHLLKSKKPANFGK